MASTLSMTFTPKILTRTGLIGATEAEGDESETSFRAPGLPIKILISIS